MEPTHKALNRALGEEMTLTESDAPRVNGILVCELPEPAEYLYNRIVELRTEVKELEVTMVGKHGALADYQVELQKIVAEFQASVEAANENS